MHEGCGVRVPHAGCSRTLAVQGAMGQPRGQLPGGKDLRKQSTVRCWDTNPSDRRDAGQSVPWVSPWR